MESLLEIYNFLLNTRPIQGIINPLVTYPIPTAQNAHLLPLGQYYDTLVDYKFPVAFTICYYLIVMIWKRCLPATPSQQKSSLLFLAFIFLHNAFLTVFSGLTFFNVLQRVLLNFGSKPLKDAFCDLDGSYWASGLGYWSWLFYLSKYYEVIDTLILLLKGRAPSFLQSYHHAGAILSLWVGVRSGANAIWIITFLNSGIHTLMYFYYCLATCGYQPKWKRYLTSLQIIQFVTGVVIGISYVFVPDCVKTAKSEEYGIIDYLSHAFVLFYVIPLTVLFIDFAKKSYSKVDGKKEKVKVKVVGGLTVTPKATPRTGTKKATKKNN